ncbi:restriction endonuclease subunit S [Ralstonia sp. UBA689]|uniref:restriction endonuclease subunit S n=1 Tax=Ralstonia sp. UBA689 TaxID=1947373 RepID=UPI0025F8E06D|nr:restriction endonuclease subunit S [Ralstonia sp. UBA689]
MTSRQLEHQQLREIITPARLVRAGDGNYPILSMTMHSGLVDQAEKFKKRVASADTSPYKVVRYNQLVVGFPIDEGVLAFQRLHDAAIVSPAYDVWDVSDFTRVDHRYLERFLRSPQACRFYVTKLQGTTARRRTLPDDIFLSLPVPLPTLPEQRRIATILDQAEALRAKRRQALALLDELAQSVFIEMFGDPVTNPKGWERKPISELGRVVTGNTPSRANAAYYGNAIEWIKSDNLGTANYYATQASESLSPEGKHVARTAPPGSILVTCIAGSPNCIGNSAMIDREVAFNQQINAFTPELGNAHFFYGQIRVGKRLFQADATSAMKGLLNKSRFEQIELLTPPLALQEQFAQRLTAIERLKSTHRAALAQLDALFASLQHRAFAGLL